MRSCASTSLLLCLGAIAGGLAQAQAPHQVGSEFQVNSHTTDLQTMPAVAVAAGGDFAVVWESQLQDGDSYGVFLQFFDAGGARLGAELQVNLYTVGAQRAPAVAASASGHFVVVWRGDGQDSDDTSGIFAQRFDGAGNRLASEFEVNSHTFSFQVAPAVAMEDGGDFVVVWASTAADPGYGIRAQRFASSGALLGVEFLVNSYTVSSQKVPSVAMDGDGDFVVAWTSLNQDGYHYGIFARRFGSNGDGLAVEFQINTYTHLVQADSTVAMDDDGDFVVAWRSYPQDGQSSGIFARRFSSSGAALAIEFQVTTYTATNQPNPAAAMDADGDFVVVWESLNQEYAGGYGVWGRRFDATGTALGSDFLVNAFTATSQNLAAIGSDAEGGFVAVWQSENQDGNFLGVFGQRFEPIGILDVDGNGTVTPLTDGLLFLRFLFDFTGTNLTANAVDVDHCTRCDAAAIDPYLTGLGLQLDIDDDQAVLPLSDGILVLRFLFDFTGTQLTSNAVNEDDCGRCEASEILPYLQSL